MYSGAIMARAASSEKYAGLFLLSSIPPTCLNQPAVNGSKAAIQKSTVATTTPQTSIQSGRKRIKRTKNRKRITKASTITVHGKTYPINTGRGEAVNQYGVYVDVIKAMISQFQICKEKWGRVFVLRQELHTPHITDTSKAITLFKKRLFPKLKRIYGFDAIGFSWAREYHGKGKGLHYHYVFFLDGRKIRHSTKIIPIIREAWEGSGRKDVGYRMGYIKRPFYFVDNRQTERDAIERISYLAKCRGKGHRPPQSKDYGCSRIKNLNLNPL